MNWNTETEQAIINTLKKMGPLTFVPLVKLTREPRQRIGHAIIRLRASGKIVIHERRLLEAARPIRVYCAARNPPSTALAAQDTSASVSGSPPVDAAGRKPPEATCSACGWQRSSTDEPKEPETGADAVPPAVPQPPVRSDPETSRRSSEDHHEERRCRACGESISDAPAGMDQCIECEAVVVDEHDE